MSYVLVLLLGMAVGAFWAWALLNIHRQDYIRPEPTAKSARNSVSLNEVSTHE